MKLGLILLSLLFQTGKQDPPPGTLLVKEYYVDKTEVMNIHYLEFLYHMKPQLESSQYQLLLPDSSNFWYEQPKNRYKPMVYISWAQAMLFCEWRTAMVREKSDMNVTYRLMKPNEWVEVGEQLLKTDLKRYERERSRIDKRVAQKKNSYYLKEISNPLEKVYNYFDNVSEMTLEKGVAMGDNNIDMSDNIASNLSRLINYNSPNAFLGFRCIAVFE